MYLKKLNLSDFKNYPTLEIEFEGKIQCLVGLNGSGKTNLLDAIHYLSLTKSAFNPFDAQNIRSGESKFVIRGEYLMGSQEASVTCTYGGQKKMMLENDEEYRKLSDHIGKYPLVLMAPGDIELIWNGSELRRRFFDSLISQIDGKYLHDLMDYISTLKQRNALLKMSGDPGAYLDRDLLATYDQQLVGAGKRIYAKRQTFLVEFGPRVVAQYEFLSDGSTENPSITYRSELEVEDFALLLKNNLKRDLLLQRTTSGVHRDDFLFKLSGNELKRWGSQGQQKSFLVALKIAEFQSITDSMVGKPILLLDDIFDKLDEPRIEKLIERVGNGMFGQLFITDARPERSADFLANAEIEASFYNVQNGILKRATYS